MAEPLWGGPFDGERPPHGHHDKVRIPLPLSDIEEAEMLIPPRNTRIQPQSLRTADYTLWACEDDRLRFVYDELIIVGDHGIMAWPQPGGQAHG